MEFGQGREATGREARKPANSRKTWKNLRPAC